MKLKVIATLLCAAQATFCYGAVEVEDQSNIATYTSTIRRGLAIYTEFNAAQVVTTGIAGQLSRVELGVYRLNQFGPPLIVDIVRVLSGVPDFSAAGQLATRTIDASSLGIGGAPGTYFTTSLDFTADRLTFGPQQQFAILLHSEASVDEGYGWFRNFGGNSYDGGGVYRQQFPGGAIFSEATDTHFRTFMLIPEPSTCAVAIVGVVALTTFRPRR